MDSFSIYDDEVAEAMFHFVEQKDTYEKFCNAQIERDVSFAEFCCDRFSEFKTYCETTFGFTIHKP